MVSRGVIFAVLPRLGGVATDQLVKEALLAACGFILVEQGKTRLIKFLEELVPGDFFEAVVIRIWCIGKDQPNDTGVLTAMRRFDGGGFAAARTPPIYGSRRDRSKFALRLRYAPPSPTPSLKAIILSTRRHWSCSASASSAASVSAAVSRSTTDSHSPGRVCRNSRIVGYHGLSTRWRIQRQSASASSNVQTGRPRAPAR